MIRKTNNVLAFERKPAGDNKKVLDFKRPGAVANVDESALKHPPVNSAVGRIADPAAPQETTGSHHGEVDRQAIERGEDEGMTVGPE